MTDKEPSTIARIYMNMKPHHKKAFLEGKISASTDGKVIEFCLKELKKLETNKE